MSRTNEEIGDASEALHSKIVDIIDDKPIGDVLYAFAYIVAEIATDAEEMGANKRQVLSTFVEMFDSAYDYLVSEEEGD